MCIRDRILSALITVESLCAIISVVLSFDSSLNCLLYTSNLFDDPNRKLRKYLRGGKLEQSGEWRFVYDRDGQLVEKYKGTGK